MQFAHSIDYAWAGSASTSKSIRMMAGKAAASRPENPLVASRSASGLGSLQGQQELAKHNEQLRQFRGWVASAIRPIAAVVSRQEFRIGRKRAAGSDSPSLMRTKGAHDAHYQKFWIDTIARAHAGIRSKALAENIDPLDVHPFLDLIQDPNEFMVHCQVVYFTIINLQLTGKAYWWLTDADPSGKVDGRLRVWPVPSSWVTPDPDADIPFDRWLIHVPGRTEPIKVDGDDMVYMSLPSATDPMGATSPLQTVAAEVGLESKILTAQAKHYQSPKPPMIVKAGRLTNPMTMQPGERPVLTKSQRKQIVEAITGMIKGVYHWDEPAIVDGLIDEIVPYGNSPHEMGYIDSGKFNKSRIWQAFGVNPIVAGEIENSNRASAWVAQKAFADNVVNPLITLISEWLTKRLAPRFANLSSRLVIWIDEFIPQDEDLEIRKVEMLARNKAIRKGEMREFADLPHDEELDEELAGPIPTGPVGPDGKPLPPGAKPGDPPAKNPNKPAKPPKGKQDGKPGSKPKPGQPNSTQTDGPETDKAFHGVESPRSLTYREMIGQDGHEQMWFKRQQDAENLLSGAIKMYFEDQAAEVAQAIEAMPIEKIKQQDPETLAAFLLDAESAAKGLRDAVRPILFDAAQGGAILELSLDRQPGKIFGGIPDAIIEKIKTAVDGIMSADYWKGIHETTVSRIATAIRNGVKSELSSRGIGQAVMVEAAGTKAAQRASDIATNEASGAVNAGSEIGMRHSQVPAGYVIVKQWFTMNDGNVRETHTPLHEKAIKLDDNFDVGGHLVPYPHHHSLPAKERANCRCGVRSKVMPAAALQAA